MAHGWVTVSGTDVRDRSEVSRTVWTSTTICLTVAPIVRRAPYALLLALLALAALLAPASPASAHAALVGSDPAPGSVIGTSPDEVTITFSEHVIPVETQVIVLAPDGKKISGRPTVTGDVLHIPVRKADKPLGTYLVRIR